MTFVTTYSGKLRTATESEQQAINAQASLKARKRRLEALKRKVRGTDSSIEKMVTNINDQYQLKRKKFKDLHEGINGILSDRSKNLGGHIRSGIDALDKEISKIDNQIENLAIPTLYPDVVVKQA